MTTPARPTPKVNVAALVTEIVEEARKNAEAPAPSKSRVIPSYVAAGLVVRALRVGVGRAAGVARAPAHRCPVARLPRRLRRASRSPSTPSASRPSAHRTATCRARNRKSGIATDQIVYQVTDSLSFELSASVDGERVTYKSSQPRDRYLAEAMTALTRARR